MQIKALRNYPKYSIQSANWFHAKWNIPAETYLESIEFCITQKTKIPQWYIVLDEINAIIAGAGVIPNDFHERKDLSPNLCALFVEEKHRNKGIAKEILNFVRKDIASLGFKSLYLITEYTHFYEKHGWKFLTMVKENSGATIRMYVATQ